MVTVHRFPGGQPYAVEIRPDATVTVTTSLDGDVVTVRLRDSSEVPCSLILPGEVARQVFGNPEFTQAAGGGR